MHQVFKVRIHVEEWGYYSGSYDEYFCNKEQALDFVEDFNNDSLQTNSQEYAEIAVYVGLSY